MFAAVFSFAYAFLIFGLVNEAQSDWLRVLGFVAGTYLVIAGAIAGWQAARE